MMRLADYQVSATTGFLSEEPPLERLPEYYNPWEDLCSNLYKLRITSKFQAKVLELPFLDTRYLTSEPEWRRAYVLLGFITSAYVWCQVKPADRLPFNIAVPFNIVSEHLDMPPFATYAAQNLWNYRRIDPSRSIEDPNNFCALTTFTDSSDESWFFSIPAAIEARGAPIIPLMLDAFKSVDSQENEKLAGYLSEISGHIEALTILLPRMYEACDPTFFYNNIRPFLAGTTSPDLPNGVIYEKSSGKGDYRVYSGPTAAQSSLFHFLDISLGIKHRPTGMKRAEPKQENNTSKEDDDKFLIKIRHYMPGPHRRFLADVSRTANIRPYVASHPEVTILQTAYNAVLEKLTDYRSKHVQMVSRYIVVPSRAAAAAAAAGRSNPLPQTNPGTAGREPATTTNEASAGSSSITTTKALGTGGTAPIEFLKQVRNETADALVLPKIK